MATAGRPASAMPCTARSPSSTENEVHTARASPVSAAATTEMVITRVRPYRSDSVLIGTTSSASAPVPSDTVNPEAAGETPNSPDSAGSSAWMAYSREKVASPAANRARLTRRKPGSPRRYPSWVTTSSCPWSAGRACRRCRVTRLP